MIKRAVCEICGNIYHDIKSAKWALLLLASVFVFFYVTTHSLCPVYGLTGFPCPGCGLTRAGLMVLRLDFASAWRMNPFIFPITALAIVWGIQRWVLNHRSGWLSWCAAGVLLAMIVFYVWRMAVFFPGEPPMDFYENCLLRRLVSK